LKKEEIVMHIGAGDVIGEEMIWFNTDPTYTAKAIS
jgi:hypothetical protein